MKSIFDGWTEQLKFKSRDGNGAFCAQGFITDSVRDSEANIARIGRWIIANMDPPAEYTHPVSGRYRMNPQVAVAWANNEGLLDIEGFKMVDGLTMGFVPEDVPEETPVAVEQEVA